MVVIDAFIKFVAFMGSLIFHDWIWTAALFIVVGADILIAFDTSNPVWNSLCLTTIGANAVVALWAAILWLQDWVRRTNGENNENI